MRYSITFPVAVSKYNGTDMPFPVKLEVKVDARDAKHALQIFEGRIQKMFEEEWPDSARDW